MNICPSLLEVNESEYNEVISELINNDIKHIHVDIMDLKFVKNSGVNISVIKQIKEIDKSVYVDAHLMVKQPLEYIDKCIEYGADCITIHFEVLDKNNTLESYIEYIKEKKANVDVGLSLNPKTKLEKTYKYFNVIDRILIMSVEPGKGRQAFIDKMFKRVKDTFDYKVLNNLPKLKIEVDGGINNSNIKTLRILGADEVVVGSYLFLGESISGRLKTLYDIIKY